MAGASKGAANPCRFLQEKRPFNKQFFTHTLTNSPAK
jgi:hypothetical protein